MPDDAWGKPWQAWCGVDEHSKKVKVYQRMMDAGEIPTLPVLDVVKELIAAREYVGVLTGASSEAVFQFLQRENLQGVIPIAWSATKHHKRERLVQLATKFPYVTYVDDEDVNGWVPPWITFVQYVGQSNDKLKEDIRWT